MAQLPEPLNANEVEPNKKIEADPKFTGWHQMQFIESEMKDTKAGDGEYLQLVAQVIDGPYKGRKLWERLNLVNRSQTAVDIARGTLSAICHATGVMNVQDSEQLHNRPFEGHVKYVPQDGTYDPKNEIDGYRPIGGEKSAPAAQASAPAASSAPAANTPPWQRKSA